MARYLTANMSKLQVGIIHSSEFELGQLKNSSPVGPPAGLESLYICDTDDLLLPGS